jgi:hypothetical protein
MELLREDETDSLSSLEERILKAVELVGTLRKENASLNDRLQATLTEKQTAEQSAAQSAAQVAAVTQELETLRAERKQVRGRIEKLLGQMDLLGAS